MEIPVIQKPIYALETNSVFRSLDVVRLSFIPKVHGAHDITNVRRLGDFILAVEDSEMS
jgi:hypothetical protein